MAGRPKKFGRGTLADADPLSLAEKKAKIALAMFAAMAPAEDLWLDEWADRYRVLTAETSWEVGPWKTSRFPFTRRIMRCLSPMSRAREIVWMKGAQVAATECAINLILYTADHAPCPILYIQGTEDAARDFSTQKLQSAIDAAPKMAQTLGRQKGANYVKSALRKGFPGGHLTLGGANSPDFLRARSLNLGIADEEDSYAVSVGGVQKSQGSPIELLRKRLANFPYSKLFRASTPVLTEMSTIEPAFLDGSQEYYYLPCPFCNAGADGYYNRLVLHWNMFEWSKDLDSETGLPREIWCVCPHCGERIFEHHKTWMLKNGLWLSSKNSEREGELYEVGDVPYVSFHLSSLYSPLGFFSWHDALRDWLKYKKTKSIPLLQVIVNQCWGETWSAAGSDISSGLLESRKEIYIAEATGEVVQVPDGGLVLTAGVDIQGDRIEVETVAWGLYDESWSIDYTVLLGPPELLGDRNFIDVNTGQPTVWGLLAEHLDTRWRHASGQDMPIECTLVDTGNWAEQAHAFCRMFEHRRVYPCKGMAGWGKSKGFFKRPKRRTERFNTLLFIVYVDELKNFIYGCLSIDDPGPGYCHFPDSPVYNSAYFKGLTAENKRVKYVNGKQVLRWENPSGMRNEPLDCRVYALGARNAYRVNLEQRAQQPTPIMPVKVPKKPIRRQASRGVGV